MDSIDRCMAIQKLISVRNFAHQDSDPCWVLEGLYLGATLHPTYLHGSSEPPPPPPPPRRSWCEAPMEFACCLACLLASSAHIQGTGIPVHE